MGWCGGSRIFDEIITVLNDNGVPDESRFNIYLDLIKVFEDEDCDALDELLYEDSQFKKAFIELNPPEKEEEEDEKWEDYD